MPEQKGFALLWRKGLQHQPYFLGPVGAEFLFDLYGRSRRRDGQWDLPILNQFPMPLGTPQQRPAAIRQDAEEPRIKPSVFTEPVEAVVHPHEGILNRFLGILFVPHHVAGEPEAPRIVELHDLQKRLFVASLGTKGDTWIDFRHKLALVGDGGPADYPCA